MGLIEGLYSWLIDCVAPVLTQYSKVSKSYV